MIKFFRRIRQQLLSENKFSRYLLYAIGEIALVMIGILLALQVNNWNEEKKLNQVKAQLITNMKSELEIAKSDLESLIAIVHAGQPEQALFFKHLNDDTPISADSLSHMLKDFLNGIPYSLQLPYYEEAKASGKLSLFKNKEVLKGYSKIINLNIGYTLHRNMSTEDYLIGSMWEVRKNAGGYDGLTDRNAMLPENIRLSDLEYKNYLRQRDVYSSLKNLQLINEFLISYLTRMNEAIIETLGALEKLWYD